MWIDEVDEKSLEKIAAKDTPFENAIRFAGNCIGYKTEIGGKKLAGLAYGLDKINKLDKFLMALEARDEKAKKDWENKSQATLNVLVKEPEELEDFRQNRLLWLEAKNCLDVFFSGDKKQYRSLFTDAEWSERKRLLALSLELRPKLNKKIPEDKGSKQVTKEIILRYYQEDFPPEEWIKKQSICESTIDKLAGKIASEKGKKTEWSDKLKEKLDPELDEMLEMILYRRFCEASAKSNERLTKEIVQWKNKGHSKNVEDDEVKRHFIDVIADMLFMKGRKRGEGQKWQMLYEHPLEDQQRHVRECSWLLGYDGDNFQHVMIGFKKEEKQVFDGIFQKPKRDDEFKKETTGPAVSTSNINESQSEFKSSRQPSPKSIPISSRSSSPPRSAVGRYDISSPDASFQRPRREDEFKKEIPGFAFNINGSQSELKSSRQPSPKSMPMNPHPPSTPKSVTEKYDIPKVKETKEQREEALRLLLNSNAGVGIATEAGKNPEFSVDKAMSKMTLSIMSILHKPVSGTNPINESQQVEKTESGSQSPSTSFSAPVNPVGKREENGARRVRSLPTGASRESGLGDLGVFSREEPGSKVVSVNPESDAIHVDGKFQDDIQPPRNRSSSFIG